MARGGQKTQKDAPERRCIATGTTGPKSGLVRFALSPDGVVTPDIAGNLPGRGIWVSANKSALATAIDKNLFSKGAKAPATIPENLAGLVEDLLVKRLISTISFARKAGLALVGFDNTKSALISGKARVLIQAFDGSDGQKRKIRPPEGHNSYISCLSAAELGLAFGREHVIHAALTPGGLTKRVISEAARLNGFRGETVNPENKGGRSPARKRTTE